MLEPEQGGERRELWRPCSQGRPVEAALSSGGALLHLPSPDVDRLTAGCRCQHAGAEGRSGEMGLSRGRCQEP